MTRGFYEQIAVRPDADLDEIKSAYARAVAHLLRRREATLAQGGDTSALDLARAQLDEAWAVLSDAARRRRYDAMLAVAGDGLAATDREDLWSRVAGAMIHPAVAAAARIVDVATTLQLGPLAEPPRPTGSRVTPAEVGVEEERPTVAPRALGNFGNGFGGPRPVRATPEPRPAIRIPPAAEGPPSQPGEPVTLPHVELPASSVHASAHAPAHASAHAPAHASTSASAPALAPGRSVSVPTTPAQDIEQLIDRVGYGGELLRTARERLGITIQQMSETTRISTRYLDAVEREDFDALPIGAAFLKGYVREMARMLGLDVDRVVAGYMRRVDREL
jgi:hypothetical protein